MSDQNDAPLLQMHSAERCAEYFRLGLERLRARNASLHPVNYALFYHDVAGSNALLSHKLDEIARQQAAWDDQMAVALFMRYLLPCNDTEASGLQEELSNAVSYVAGTATDLADSTATHAAALEVGQQQLAASKNAREAQEAAAGLLRESRDLHAMATAKEQELRNAAQQIRMLRAELMRVRRETSTDSLTGLASRKVFDQELERLVQEKRECGLDFSLIMMDIDHFKQVNDDYGHLIGDKVLRQLAGVASKNTRETDVSARYGGEEFAILLPDTYLDQARRIAEDIRQAISKLNMRRSDTGEKIRNMTASFGVAQCVASETGTDLISRADKAMYAAKAKGRNRTEAASAPNGL